MPSARPPRIAAAAGVAVAWARGDARHEGHVALLSEGEQAVLGHEPAGGRSLRWLAQRPGRNEDVPAPSTAGALALRARGDLLEVRAGGTARLRVDGVEVTEAPVRAGTVVHVPGEIVLVGVRRPPLLPALRAFPHAAIPAFGEPDVHGWVGESPEAWRVRDLVAVSARAPAHVLLLGASGTGKGIAARALHALSPRAAGALVICSDGQLGEADDVIARAAGGTLVIDPGEALSADAQQRLLQIARTQRVESLAAAGQTLMRLQVVVLARRLDAAFNEELRSRCLTVNLPPLDARREDIPLLARARASAMARAMPELGAPFVDSRSAAAAVALDDDLIAALLLREWTSGVFEIDRVLFQAMTESPGPSVGLPAALSRRGGPATLSPTPPAAAAPTLAQRLGLPTPQTWGDIRIRPVDGLTVLVTVRTKSARCTHVELGLSSAKSRGPTKAWELLLATCEGRGSFDWRRFGETRDTARKQVERLSQALGESFGLEDPPFEPFDARRGWSARFLAVPER